MSNSKRIPTDGGSSLTQNPFAALSSIGLPATAEKSTAARNDSLTNVPTKLQKNRGRVDIKRTTAHRGGKTVTLVTGFVGIGLPEKEILAKKMQKTCGTGGTVKDGNIEIQGDQREKVATILAEAGFRPVMAGG